MGGRGKSGRRNIERGREEHREREREEGREKILGEERERKDMNNRDTESINMVVLCSIFGGWYRWD